MTSMNGTRADGIRYTDVATAEDKLGIASIIASFDWNAAPPDIDGFFDALGQAIVFDGTLPPDVYLFSLILKGQKELKNQQLMLQILAANPVYTAEQKETLNVLMKRYNLLLPAVSN